MSQSSIIEKIVRTTGDLPTMPHIASMVMEKISKPETTAKEIHQIISQDQALAARVLRIANSPFYGGARNVTRLTDAIVIMGFNSIRSLVMTSVMNDLFKNFGLAEKLLWDHSLGCASAARIIARAVRFSNTELAFLAGLMHDIGKVVLNLKLPDKMLTIVQEVYNSSDITFSEAEMRHFGFTHAQIGQLIARKWNFAVEIEEAIGAHHCPERAKNMPHLAFIVHLANACCHKLEIGPTKHPDLDMSTVLSVRAFKLPPEKVDELLGVLSEALSSQPGLGSF